MAKTNGLGLQETKGNFQIMGVTSGCDAQNFFTEKLTKTNKNWRSVNFAVEYDKDKKIYCGLNGMERDKVYFSKTVNGATDVKAIAWKDRRSFKEEGYRPIGVNVGVQKMLNEQGQEVNNKMTLCDFDACEEIHKHLVDDKPVFVKGKLEFSTYNGKHSTKFVPNQVSLMSRDIDFDRDNFTPVNDFEQTICLMGVTANEDKSRFIISAKIIGYNSIEDVEFMINKDHEKLARTLKKLKPYTSVKVSGKIVVRPTAVEVEEDDEWGDANPMTKISTPFERELVVTGADRNSVDDTIYSEEKINAALAMLNANATAKADFGSTDDEWGSVPTKKSNIPDDIDEWDDMAAPF